MTQLCLHSGGEVVTPEVLKAVPTPDPVGIWRPIPHSTLYEMVLDTITNNGYVMDKVEMGVAKDGKQFFAIMSMGTTNLDYTLTVGLRNSHDKMFPAGLAVGSRVFVCDNLAFSSEIVVARKHTLNILNDLPKLVAGAVGKIALARKSQDERLELYKGYFIDDYDAHDLIIRSVDYGVIPNQVIPKVLHEWREPSHEEFEPRTVWSLFNGFTEVCKRFPVAELPVHTTKLHGMLDQFVGFGEEDVEVSDELLRH